MFFFQFVAAEEIQQQQNPLFPLQESPDGFGGPPRRFLLATPPTLLLGAVHQISDPQHAGQQHDQQGNAKHHQQLPPQTA
jgi:hypothetical protein